MKAPVETKRNPAGCPVPSPGGTLSPGDALTAVGRVGSKSCLSGQEPLTKATLDMEERLGVNGRLPWTWGHLQAGDRGQQGKL